MSEKKDIVVLLADLPTVAGDQSTKSYIKLHCRDAISEVERLRAEIERLHQAADVLAKEAAAAKIADASRARGGEVMPYAADKTELLDTIEGLLANWPSSEVVNHYTAESRSILMKDEALKRAGDAIRARGGGVMTEAEWRSHPGPWAHLTKEQCDAFIASAIAAEREACAKIADGFVLDADPDESYTGEQVARGYTMLARQIRARGGK